MEYSNNIEIKLLANRRFLYANRRQSIVITAEHNATEITVLFPEEYEDYSKRVDFVNSKGKEWTEALYIPEYKSYPAEFDKSRFCFTLPTEVTTEGELKMQFLAYNAGDMTTVPFEVVPIDIVSGVLAFKKNARSNPDLLIFSYNRATEALFKAEQAKAKSIKAEEQSQEAVDASKEADETSDEALMVANEAREIAVENAGAAADSAAQASESASNAAISAAQAATTATLANTKADNAVATVNLAKEAAIEAVNTSVEADNKATRAVATANQADGKADGAIVTANQARATAQTAESNSADAVIAAGQAQATAQAADGKSNTAISTANDASMNADAARGVADYAKSRADFAVSQAEQAVTIASDAVTQSAQANAKSDQAVQTANLAQSLIGAAIVNAETALQIASGVDAKAQTALDRSLEARQVAGDAETLAVEAKQIAEDAKVLIESADEKAENAISTAENSDTKADQAMTVAGNAQSTANDAVATANGATATANTALTTANTADSKATNALAQANAAQTAAAQAESNASAAETTAGQAKTKATQAETIATQAKTTAENAEVAVGNKVDKVAGKGLSTEDYTTAEKSKLAGITAGANNYTHPASHPPAIIAQDANNRFVSDTEKNMWNSAAGIVPATPTSNGLMSAADKVKLNEIAANANNYTHPANHAPSVITQDANNRFVSDTEKATWNGKVDKVPGKQLSTEDYTSAEKTKLVGIATGAQVNAVISVAGKTGAVTLAKSDVGLGNVDNTADASKPVSTATQTELDKKVDKVTGKQLSTEDYTSSEKTKLSGIATGAQVNTVTSVAGKTGAVTLAKGDVGLGSVDNTADSTKAVASAAKLTTARTISLTGAVTGSVSFDGSGNASVVTSVGTIPASSISITANSNLGGATTLQAALNYIANVFAGTQKVTKIRAGTLDVDA